MFLRTGLIFSVLACVCVFLFASSARADDKPTQKSGKSWVYVGTYTGDGSKGIYRFELDSTTGKLSAKALAGESPNPSFVVLHPSGKYLFAVSEVGMFGGKKSGAVSAFAIDPKTGDLALLNQQPSGGDGPCHLTIDKQGKHVLVANYGGGNASVLPIQADGKLGEATAFVQHKGSSVDKGRQEAPHAHSINLDPANRFAVVADLGLDKVMVYSFDSAKGTLKANDPPALVLAPGSGPRHFAFHPDGKHAYVINEMASTVAALGYDAEQGAFKTLQTISTLPKDFKGNTSTAEVQVHPSGKFLYGSNRGHDSIAIFAIDPKSGELTFVGHQGKNIKTPRNFGIDPTGNFMIVANQGSNSLVVFRIDLKTGELTPVGDPVEVAKPVCVKMLAR